MRHGRGFRRGENMNSVGFYERVATTHVDVRRHPFPRVEHDQLGLTFLSQASLSNEFAVRLFHVMGVFCGFLGRRHTRESAGHLTWCDCWLGVDSVSHARLGDSTTVSLIDSCRVSSFERTMLSTPSPQFPEEPMQ
jgi:hypothetical protein